MLQIYSYGRHMRSHYIIALGFVLMLIFGNVLRMGKIIVKEREQWQ
ncbi:MAG: hypothetical protein M3156_04380 [Thermoproteota archaeon]|jgi:hypothetical protein|nr:hypothetical protein [Thermoproteota archaeon]